IIIDNSSLNDAGLWEAVFKIGIYFNMFFTVPISIYFLPRFSGLKDPTAIKELMISCFIFSLPLMSVFGLFIYIFRGPIVDILFSSEFTEIKTLIPVLLMAEFFKISAGFFGVFFMANRLLYENIRNEFIWVLLFIVATYYAIESYGLSGVVYSYLISCIIWLVLNLWCFIFHASDLKD
ncbi:MAG: hypothetical protein RPR97_02835, partial [Colwellia sp.]